MRELIVTKDSSITNSLGTIIELSDRAYRAAYAPGGRETTSRPEMVISSIRRRVKTTLQSIQSQENAIRAHQRYIRKYKVEIHKKITLPFACLFFFLVGAPVGVWTRKGGIGIAIGLGLVFFVVYWAFLIGGEELADRGFVAPWLAMWSPNFVMLLISLVILYRTTYSSRFRGFGILNKLTRWVGGIFGRRKRRKHPVETEE